MNWTRRGACAVGLASIFVLSSGCAQYQGYHSQSKKVVTNDWRLHKKGKVHTLGLDVKRASEEPSPTFELAATLRSTDVFCEYQTLKWTRTDKLGRYSIVFDFVAEPCLWVVGPVSSLAVWKWPEAFYTWPPFDLLARLCGAHGCNGWDYGSQKYAAHPPGYFRRLGQWVGWLVPGYGVLHRKDREKQEQWSTTRLGKTRQEERTVPAASAKIVLRTAGDAPAEVILTTDSKGKAVWNASGYLEGVGRGMSWGFHARAECQGVAAEVTKTYAAADLGVTSERAVLRLGGLPELVARLEFEDSDGNRVLNSDETATVAVTVTNRGKGAAMLVGVGLAFAGRPEGLTISPAGRRAIDRIGPGEEKRVTFTVKADRDAPDQDVRVRVSFGEAMGFRGQPVEARFLVRP